MRSLIQGTRRSDDSGATLVWVALMMTVLLGFGAIVIDVGAVAAEKRQLQNGADAAALAVAQDCAGGLCEPDIADSYADDNTGDGAATIDEVCGKGPGLDYPCNEDPEGAPASNWVMVATSTDNDNAGTDRDDEVDFVLAPIFGETGENVDATAIAAWGAVGRATTIPITFSVCEFKALGGTVDGTTFPNTTGYVYLHGEGPDHGCVPGPGSSGLNLPGGFGWLDRSRACETDVVAGGWVGSDTGNNVPGTCNPVTWRNADVLIPLYDETRGSGSNGEYHVIGFAAFTIRAYKLDNGNEWNMPGSGKCPGTPGNSGRCVYGEFTKFVTSGEIGGGTDFGAHAIEMIG